MNRSLHDAIEGIFKDAEDRALVDLAHEKTASAEELEAEVDENGLEDRLEKVATALDWIVDELSQDPSVEVRQRLRLAKEATGGAHPGVGANKLSTTAAKGGKQSYETGQAKSQITSSGLQSAPGHPKAGVADNDAAMKAFLGQKQPQISKLSSSDEREALRQKILAKTGQARKGNEPNITGAVLAGPPGVSKAGEGSPPGKGAKGAGLVSSIDKVINMTKGQGKALVKPDLKTVLKEPPLSRKTDPVLHNNLRNTSKAGVKIASIKDRFKTKKEGGNR